VQQLEEAGIFNDKYTNGAKQYKPHLSMCADIPIFRSTLLLLLLRLFSASLAVLVLVTQH
jgi:hypothetical protein